MLIYFGCRYSMLALYLTSFAAVVGLFYCMQFFPSSLFLPLPPFTLPSLYCIQSRLLSFVVCHIPENARLHSHHCCVQRQLQNVLF